MRPMVRPSTRLSISPRTTASSMRHAMGKISARVGDGVKWLMFFKGVKSLQENFEYPLACRADVH
jgi:hypothetical protein